MGVLRDHKIPNKLKGKLFCSVLCFMVVSVEQWKGDVGDMRMLRWMCGHIRINRVLNACIRER